MRELSFRRDNLILERNKKKKKMYAILKLFLYVDIEILLEFQEFFLKDDISRSILSSTFVRSVN